MRWFFPSWNGDLELRPSEDDANKTELLVVKPTLDEQRILNAIGTEAVAQGWLKEWSIFKPEKGLFAKKKTVFTLDASLEKVGPVVTRIMKPGPAVLTAVKFKGGEIQTCSGSKADLDALAEKATLATTTDKPAEAAATVKRPTPSCPQCKPGSVDPAREVLLSFLTSEEHAMWAQARAIVVTGGLTGHDYLIAHRHSRVAQHMGRICYDLTLDTIMHFHDWTVPPEEEVLAAKLILEHAEPWLRNEATLFHVPNSGMIVVDRPGKGLRLERGLDPMKFKNPFGDISDGVQDASFASTIGSLFGLSPSIGMSSNLKGEDLLEIAGLS